MAKKTNTLHPVNGYWRAPFTAGMLVRGQIRRQLQQYCEANDLEYKLKEFKGPLESEFVLVIKADGRHLLHAQAIANWMNDLTEEL